MTALVTKHLPLVAGAPDGIKKLRALILELAVRGKLVPHDPSDEPVVALLARTADAKAALQPRGRVKAKKSPHDVAGGYPYVIPSSWKWCRLADLVEVLNGRAYKKEELLEDGTPVLRVGNLFTSNHWYYSNLTLEEDRYCVPGDLLYAWSASFGPFIWTGERSIYHYHIWKLAPHSDADLCRRYLHDYLQAQTAAIKAAGHGVSMTHMTKEKMEQLPVPLPPLGEQHRIVAKVDELMALCDRLEADQADAEAAHAQLVQALLGSLTQAADAADFRASWQRLSEHFHTLFTTEASIDALKQTVLQLAVMGRLVHQSAQDEPASDLLVRVRCAAIKVAKAGRGGTPLPDDLPFVLPNGWAWARFNDLIAPESPIAYGVLVPGPDSADGVPFVRIADLDLIAPKHLPEKRISPEVDAQFARTKLRGGEILMGVVGSVGKLGLAPTSWAGANIARAICRIVPASEVSKPYVLWLLQTQFMRQQFLGDTRTLAQPTLNVGLIRDALTPVPPLAEQHRIVAKVDELMTLCDQLKAQLAEARQQHAQLATVLVEQAVAVH